MLEGRHFCWGVCRECHWRSGRIGSDQEASREPTWSCARPEETPHLRMDASGCTSRREHIPASMHHSCSHRDAPDIFQARDRREYRDLYLRAKQYFQAVWKFQSHQFWRDFRGLSIRFASLSLYVEPYGRECVIVQGQVRRTNQECELVGSIYCSPLLSWLVSRSRLAHNSPLRCIYSLFQWSYLGTVLH